MKWESCTALVANIFLYNAGFTRNCVKKLIVVTFDDMRLESAKKSRWDPVAKRLIHGKTREDTASSAARDLRFGMTIGITTEERVNQRAMEHA